MTWKPGISGNPLGKPKGCGDRRLEVRRMLESHSEEMVEIVIEMARQRDPVALKLIFERISPKPRSESINLGVDVNKLNDHKGLMEMTEKLLGRAVTGDLPDEQGKTIASLTKTMSDLYNNSELEDRIKALEGC